MKPGSLLSAIGVMLIIAGGAWWYYDGLNEDHDRDGAPITRDAAGTILAIDQTATRSDCSGRLFDTHVHLDESTLPGLLAPLMRSNGVACAVLFIRMDPDDMADTVEQLQESIGAIPNRFIPFMHIDPKTAEEERAERIRTALNATNIPWRGLGEVAFYRDPFRGDDLTNERWDENFTLAAEQNLIFMIHPRSTQGSELMQLLADHPKTTILFHGSDLPINTITRILETYPNVYFTLDTATLITTPSILGPLQFADNMTPAQFAAVFDVSWAAMLETAVRDWAPVVAAAPERVMWGTDAAFAWHADPEVYQRLIEFSQEFIQQLPLEQQAGFAIENAKQLFGNPVSLLPLEQ